MFDRFRGVLDDVYGEGTWLMLPWLQTPQVRAHQARRAHRAETWMAPGGERAARGLQLRGLQLPRWRPRSACPEGGTPAHSPSPLRSAS